MTAKQKTDTEKKRPLVSIGVPVYNGEKYLEECLDSILNQTYDRWECVICNNYSSDRTPEIAEKYVKKDSRFRLVHTDELLPITSNWNFCFSKIDKHSDYFKINPADDWMFPDFLSEMVRVMESHPEVGVCASYRLVDKEIIADGLDIYHGNRFPGKEIIVKELKKELDVSSSANAVLYRIETLKKLNYYPSIYQDESFHIDSYLSFDLLLQSDLGFVFQVLSFIRRHEDTVTSTVSSKLNTPLYFRELALNKYQSLDVSLQAEYRKTRIRYAYFLLKSKLFSRRDILSWHQKKLARPIKIREYLHAVVRRMMLKNI